MMKIMETVMVVGIKGLRIVMRQNEKKHISIRIEMNLTIINLINSHSRISLSQILKGMDISQTGRILIGTVIILYSSWIGRNGTGTTA